MIEREAVVAIAIFAIGSVFGGVIFVAFPSITDAMYGEGSTEILTWPWRLWVGVSVLPMIMITAGTLLAFLGFLRHGGR